MTTAIWETDATSGTAATRLARFVVAEAPPTDHRRRTETLAAAAVAGDAQRVDAALAAALDDGATIERVLIGPVTSAARRLGDFWIEDSCDFVAVTMAMWQLRGGVERLLDRHPSASCGSGRRAVLTAAPGDQHGFGAFLIGEVFARAGWTVVATDGDTLADVVADDWIDLVGLTVTADRHRNALAPTIAAVRRASRNPRLVILIGGRVVGDDPALVRQVGADGTAPDALSALALADRLVAPPGPPC